MSRFNPFPPVDGKYGAPMGRISRRLPEGLPLCVSHPQGEYDSGGAYWGMSPPYQYGGDNSDTGPVYAVWVRGKGKEYGVAYVRAWNKQQAKERACE